MFDAEYISAVLRQLANERMFDAKHAFTQYVLKHGQAASRTWLYAFINFGNDVVKAIEAISNTYATYCADSQQAPSVHIAMLQAALANVSEQAEAWLDEHQNSSRGTAEGEWPLSEKAKISSALERYQQGVANGFVNGKRIAPTAGTAAFNVSLSGSPGANVAFNNTAPVTQSTGIQNLHQVQKQIEQLLQLAEAKNELQQIRQMLQELQSAKTAADERQTLTARVLEQLQAVAIKSGADWVFKQVMKELASIGSGSSGPGTIA